MDLYLVNKFQSKHENIMYVGKMLYDLLNKPLEIDELFDKFSKIANKKITKDYEEILILSLCFMYLSNMVEIDGNKLRRIEKWSLKA